MKVHTDFGLDETWTVLLPSLPYSRSLDISLHTKVIITLSAQTFAYFHNWKLVILSIRQQQKKKKKQQSN